MSKDTPILDFTQEAINDALTQILREGARQLLLTAVEDEIQHFLKKNTQQNGKNKKLRFARDNHIDDFQISTIGRKEVEKTKGIQTTWRGRTGNPLTLEEQLLTVQQVTLHRQKAGRGGKTVTLVTLKGGSVKPEDLSRSLRKGLGCGSFVEGETIVLQGDISGRAQEWFVKKGVKKIVLGN